MEKSSGVQAEIQVKPSYGLSDDQVTQMLRDSMSFAKEDMQARMLKEQQVEALRVIESLNASLNEDSYLLDESELAALRLEIAALVVCYETATTPDQLKNAIEKVDKASSEFASLRMDASIKKALQGQSVDEV